MGDASGELPSFAHEVFAESEERVVAREPSRQTDLSEILCMTRVGRRWRPEERHDGNEHGSARARHRGSRPEAGHRPVWRRWSGKANHKTSRREDAPGGNGRASRLRAKRAE